MSTHPSEIPSLTLHYNPPVDEKNACGVSQPFPLAEELTGKTAIIVTVPGAFTPTCHNKHISQYVEKYDELKSKGIDKVIVIATNDQFVMHAWAQSLNAGSKLLFVGDANGEFTKAMGLGLDLSSKGMGALRCKRSAILVKDMKVVAFKVEESPGNLDVSSVTSMMSHL
ncbi:peroxiredoxin type-2 [Entomophthora muscae]|uniref:Peroxiredoxin type-2 n=1 Tax=Entomophthora muscae TaxID=34485 RepID=A0ACC2RJ99_9FUNG|nr:peroxiredoxin type-2 [Entomophthora muscae]